MGHQTSRSNRSGHMYINNILSTHLKWWMQTDFYHIYRYTAIAILHFKRIRTYSQTPLLLLGMRFFDPTYQVPSWEMALQEIHCPNLLLGDVWKPYAKKSVCLLAFTHDLSWTHPAHLLSVLDLCQELESSSTLSAWTFQTILRQTQHQCLITQFATSVM